MLADTRSGLDITGRLKITLGLAALLVLVLTLPATASAANKPPPLPSCFATGSGFDTCQGEVIPCCGSVTKLIAPEDSKGDFTLTGPAPLQTTKPTQCGDGGCVYNHLNWYIGAGAAVRKGCKPNETVCEVRVARSAPVWSVVYVRQNNDNPTLWAIWNSGHPSRTISGSVKVKECGETCKVVPLTGVAVSASGPHGSGNATTAADGKYSITVPKGNGYTVKATFRGLTFKPAKRKANASGGNASGIDFTAEPECGTILPETARAAAGCQLKITIDALPKKVQLEAEDDGKIKAKFIKIRVRIRNPTPTTIGNVQLLTLKPVPVDLMQHLDPLTFGAKLPVKIGDIGAGKSVLKTFDLKVTGDGDYQVDALALFDDPSRPGGNGRAIGQGGKFTVEAPLLYFKATSRVPVVDEGGSWYITGHVKNLSTHQTLCLSPLYPRFKDNSGGLGPHQIGVVPVDDPAPPLAGPLPPGETISFLMRVSTEIGGGPTSGVEIKPRAVKGDDGDTCDVLSTEDRHPITEAETKLAKDSTKFRVAVEHTTLAPPNAGPLEFFGGYADRSAGQIAQWFKSGVSIAREYGSIEKLKAGLGSAASTACSRLYHLAATAAWFWGRATLQEKILFELQIAGDLARGAGKIWDGVSAKVEKAVGEFMDHLTQAYLTGDWGALFRALGSGTAGTLNEQAIQLAEWELGLGLVNKTGTVGKALVRFAQEQLGVITSLRKITPGRLLTFAEMRKWWGLAQEDYAAFLKIAEEEEVLIGVRGRSPESVRSLQEGGVWKHEELKPKNVNDIDIEFLGFEKTDKGLVAFRTYSAEQEAAIKRAIEAKLPPGLARDTALKRLETRVGEKSYVKKIQALSDKGEIDVGFNYADNGAEATNTSNVRGFNLKPHQLDSGQKYYLPYQENPALDYLATGTGKLPRSAGLCIRKVINTIAKVLCRVTGDMDGVYLTDLQGRALDATKRIRVYLKLQEAGWQHPETTTWINKGLFDFKTKSGRLADNALGGEALMEFAPKNKVRTTYLDLEKSELTNEQSPKDYFVAVVGGYTQTVLGLK